MADMIAATGLIVLGAVGAAAVMMFLGYRRPLAHERAVFRLIEAFRAELAMISRQSPK